MSAEKTLRVLNLGCIRQHKELFAELSFQLHSREVLLIEGSNGSGKSSLLKLLTGLSTPDAGQIFWQNKFIHDADSDYHRHLHFVGHTNGIKLGLTVTENLRLTHQLSSDRTGASFDPVLGSLQLLDHAHTPARYLSAGQKRRLSLAKLFLFPKPLWILDEPFTALDTQTQTFFLSCLQTHLQNEGMAIISSHHSLSLPLANVQTLRLTSC